MVCCGTGTRIPWLDPHYFRSKGADELPFSIELGHGEVIPIEVQSEKGYRHCPALDNVLVSPSCEVAHIRSLRSQPSSRWEDTMLPGLLHRPASQVDALKDGAELKAGFADALENGGARYL